MHREVQCLALQVPQGDVARGQRVDEETSRMAPFPQALVKALPEEFHVEWIFTDQHGPAQVIHDSPRGVGGNATLSFAVPDEAAVGGYAHHQGLVHIGFEGVPVHRNEIRGGRAGSGWTGGSAGYGGRAARARSAEGFRAACFSRDFDREGFDVRDLHGLNPPGVRRGAPFSPAWGRNGPPPPPGRSAPP